MLQIYTEFFYLHEFSREPNFADGLKLKLCGNLILRITGFKIFLREFNFVVFAKNCEILEV